MIEYEIKRKFDWFLNFQRRKVEKNSERISRETLGFHEYCNRSVYRISRKMIGFHENRYDFTNIDRISRKWYDFTKKSRISRKFIRFHENS